MSNLGVPADRPALAPPAATTGRRLREWARNEHLQIVLAVGDAAAVLIGFYAVMSFLAPTGPGWGTDRLLQVVAVMALGLATIRSQGLWVGRIIAVRALELTRLTKAAAIIGVGTIVLDRAIELGFHVENVVVGCVVGLMTLVAWRSVYRTWLGAQRNAGNFQRRVIIVGTDRRAVALANIFATHPEQGIKVVGLVGSARAARAAGLGGLWLANYADADVVLANADVEGVVLCSSDIDPALLDVLIKGERDRTRDLYLDPGLSGIDFRRVQTLPIAHEPLLYVESPSLSQLQLHAKRAFDASVAAVMLALFAPVFLAVAIMIKLEDRGPILFRQKRVGLDGVEFEMLKFRSMCVNAEAGLAALRASNDRSGPLFKMDGRDPRVTKVGSFLRATSLDELPQLLNVLRGTMSLVGPRPALASEVADFPEELRARHQVRPGITGLWQVEARDNPSFDAYRRLDLFYVENWSMALDLVILLGTVEQVLLRPMLARRRSESAAEQAAEPADAVSAPEVAVA